MEKFFHYLLSRESFASIMSHKTLRSGLDKNDINELLVRWHDLSDDYQFKIFYRIVTETYPLTKILHKHDRAIRNQNSFWQLARLGAQNMRKIL